MKEAPKRQAMAKCHRRRLLDLVWSTGRDLVVGRADVDEMTLARAIFGMPLQGPQRRRLLAVIGVKGGRDV